MSTPVLGLLLRSGGHEAAHYALVLATAAAAVGRDVIIFATNDGCALLRADPAALLADPRESALAARGVAGIGVLLPAARDLGVRLIACDAGLRATGLETAELAVDVEVAGVVTFLVAVGTGQMLSL
ncbi:peroxiredoxin family protein [Humitalea rosea]|uniref:Peroxiredoxin family protein n=1 Tax=Humitalea rosea TaxID=990373 RepID=A0A2W7IJC4_9PROT|nr:DsrE family protein [Humitalea rosea]PZW47054.1 peroxiredoxin family protein [Humitalea rosea]